MEILAERTAQQLVYSTLSREIGIAIDTVKRWIDLLEDLVKAEAGAGGERRLSPPGFDGRGCIRQSAAGPGHQTEAA